jgi:hypothetical protein
MRTTFAPDERPMTMATAAKVLDRNRFEARARIGDLIALGLVVVVGFSLMVDMYAVGHASATNPSDTSRDAQFVRAIAEFGIVVAALCWIAYRLFSGGARRAGG